MKAIYATGAAAASVGVPAAGYGVWSLSSVDNAPSTNPTNPTNPTSSVISGYVQSKPSAAGLYPENIKTDLLDGSEVGEVSFGFQTGTCFKNFFPGASIGLPDNLDNQSAPSDWNILPAGTPKTTSSDSDQAIGCTAMQMKKSASGSDHYAFKSEITAKKGDIGWSLETGLAFQSKLDATPSVWSWKEYITFMEKKGEKWEVVGGLLLGDSDSNTDNRGYKVDNFSPGGEEGWFTNPQAREYLGFWLEGGDGSTKEILEGVRVKMIANDDISSIETITDHLLGGSWWWGKGENSTSFSLEAIYRNGKWHGISNNNKTRVSKESVKNALDSFYSPFKGKKGSWIKQGDSSDKCSQLYAKSGLKETDDDFQKYSNFCYIKQS